MTVLSFKPFQNYGELRSLRESDFIRRESQVVDPTLEELVEVRRLLIKEKARNDRLAVLLREATVALKDTLPVRSSNQALLERILREVG